jgi:hypothetical protein
MLVALPLRICYWTEFKRVSPKQLYAESLAFSVLFSFSPTCRVGYEHTCVVDFSRSSIILRTDKQSSTIFSSVLLLILRASRCLWRTKVLIPTMYLRRQMAKELQPQMQRLVRTERTRQVCDTFVLVWGGGLTGSTWQQVAVISKRFNVCSR